MPSRVPAAPAAAPQRARVRAGAEPMSRGRALGLALALGAAAGAGHVPFAAWWLALPAFAAAFALALPVGPGRAAGLGWAFGTAHFLFALHWLVEPFLIDVERHGWLAPVALVGLSAFLALLWSGAFWLAACLAPPGTARRALALPLAMTGAEMIRGFLWTGFPWAMPAYIWSETPLYQALALVGPWGLTLLTLLAASGGAWAWARRRPLPALAPALLLAALALWGAGRAAPPPGEGAPLVRLVQPNAAQQVKWDPAYAETWLARAMAATADRAGGPPPDLVVWPETSIPYLLEHAGPTIAAAREAAGEAALVFGIQRRAEGRYRNAMLAYPPGAGPAALYDKHHLVPGGEYVPGGEIVRRLGLRGVADLMGGYAPGPGPAVVPLGAGLTALPLICYEAVFPDNARAPGWARPDMLLGLTNDAWFGTFAGPFQHLAQARARAVEQGLPMLRAANTGVSAIIDAAGRTVAELPLGVSGHLDAPLPPALPPTPYARTGDWPLAALLLAALLALALAGRLDRPRGGV